MYSFVNTNEKIQTNPEVLKALKKFEKLDGDFEVKISRGDESKGESIFVCKIKNEKLVKVSGGDRPEYATKNCVADMVDAVRKLNSKNRDKKRSADIGKRTIPSDEGMTE